MNTLNELSSKVFRGVSRGVSAATPALEQLPEVKIRDLYGSAIAPVQGLDVIVATPAARARALKEGDILVAALGKARKFAVVGSEHVGCLPSGHLLVVRPIDAEARARIVSFLGSDAGREALSAVLTGVVIAHLSKSALEAVRIP